MSDLEFPDTVLRRAGLSRQVRRNVGAWWTDASEQDRVGLLDVLGRVPAAEVADTVEEYLSAQDPVEVTQAAEGAAKVEPAAEAAEGEPHEVVGEPVEVPGTVEHLDVLEDQRAPGVQMPGSVDADGEQLPPPVGSVTYVDHLQAALETFKTLEAHLQLYPQDADDLMVLEMDGKARKGTLAEIQRVQHLNTARANRAQA